MVFIPASETDSSKTRSSSEPLGGATRWKIATPDPDVVRRIVRSERVPELVAHVAVNRGHATPADVAKLLSPSLHDLGDPAGLPDMDKAAARLQRAIESRETILVHGDYDVDGVSGTVLLVRLVRLLGADVHWHIPHRTQDGYSFGDHSVAKAEEIGATLVISVDNGTSAVEPINALADRGIDVIVTDHHEPPAVDGGPGKLPRAFALVNPKLPTSDYPFRELCGSAVAFKLAWATCQRISGGERVRPDLRAFLLEALGYVAIATICDVVPLVGENRVLAHFGLRALVESSTPGMLALLDRVGLTGRALTAEDVGFQIGPRINASGRMDSAARAVEAMLALDAPTGRTHAETLERLNETRRAVEREVLTEALEQAEERADDPVLVVGAPGWHPGVVGIVASRLVDRFERPALVIGIDADGVGRGSARSVPGVSVLDLMGAGAEHMRRFGGHAMAAGCEISGRDLIALREAIVAGAKMSGRRANGPRPLEIDARVDLQGLDESLMNQLTRLEPCGERNPKPVFLSEGVGLEDMPRIIGKDRTHLLLQLRSGRSVFKALAFGMAAREPELRMGRTMDVVYTPRFNHFRGQITLELVVADFSVN